MDNSGFYLFLYILSEIPRYLPKTNDYFKKGSFELKDLEKTIYCPELQT